MALDKIQRETSFCCEVNLPNKQKQVCKVNKKEKNNQGYEPGRSWWMNDGVSFIEEEGCVEAMVESMMFVARSCQKTEIGQ